jgi:hypothetical protein
MEMVARQKYSDERNDRKPIKTVIDQFYSLVSSLKTISLRMHRHLSINYYIDK